MAKKKKVRVTAAQRSARRKNMAVARQSRWKSRGKGKHARGGKITERIDWKNTKYSQVKGKGKQALLEARSSSLLKRVVEIQQNRDMSALSKSSRKKVKILLGKMHKSTMAQKWLP